MVAVSMLFDRLVGGDGVACGLPYPAVRLRPEPRSAARPCGLHPGRFAVPVLRAAGQSEAACATSTVSRNLGAWVEGITLRPPAAREARRQ